MIVLFRVVSPKDLTVVAKKKMLLKDKKSHTKIPKRIEEKPIKQVIHKEIPIPKEIIEEEPEPPAEVITVFILNVLMHTKLITIDRMKNVNKNNS